jgi:hypothetical protein
MLPDSVYTLKCAQFSEEGQMVGVQGSLHQFQKVITHTPDGEIQMLVGLYIFLLAQLKKNPQEM